MSSILNRNVVAYYVSVETNKPLRVFVWYRMTDTAIRIYICLHEWKWLKQPMWHIGTGAFLLIWFFVAITVATKKNSAE